MNGVTLVPAYGRDYKSRAEARAAFLEQRQDFLCLPMGRYCSVRDARAMQEDGITHLHIRFKQMREVFVLPIAEALAATTAK